MRLALFSLKFVHIFIDIMENDDGKKDDSSKIHYILLNDKFGLFSIVLKNLNNNIIFLLIKDFRTQN